MSKAWTRGGAAAVQGGGTVTPQPGGDAVPGAPQGTVGSFACQGTLDSHWTCY